MIKKPIVGITHSINQSKLSCFAIKLAIWLGGGKPMMITEKSNYNNYNYHCLLLYGGVDIDPQKYHHQRKPNYNYDFSRDHLEEKHFHNAFKKNIPILGICRGAQFINIILEGDLFTDIRKIDEKTKYPNHIIGFLFFRKQIKISKGSIAEKILKKTSVKVNSIHSQSINKLGHNLKVTAKEKNNIVQAIEHQTHPFILGVQFHPEFMLYRACFRNIFSSFINEGR